MRRPDLWRSGLGYAAGAFGDRKATGGGCSTLSHFRPRAASRRVQNRLQHGFFTSPRLDGVHGVAELLRVLVVNRDDGQTAYEVCHGLVNNPGLTPRH